MCMGLHIIAASEPTVSCYHRAWAASLPAQSNFVQIYQTNPSQLSVNHSMALPTVCMIGFQSYLMKGAHIYASWSTILHVCHMTTHLWGTRCELIHHHCVQAPCFNKMHTHKHTHTVHTPLCPPGSSLHISLELVSFDGSSRNDIIRQNEWPPGP